MMRIMLDIAATLLVIIGAAMVLIGVMSTAPHWRAGLARWWEDASRIDRRSK